MHDSETYFLLLISICGKFLHMPRLAMVWRTLLTEQMKEHFGLHNMRITIFSGKSIRKDV